MDWSLGGKFILYEVNDPKTGRDLWYLEFEFVTLSLAILAHPHGLSEGMLFLPGFLFQLSVDLLAGHTLGFQTEGFSDIGSFGLPTFRFGRRSRAKY